jgi:hypothetical protein
MKDPQGLEKGACVVHFGNYAARSGKRAAYAHIQLQENERPADGFVCLLTGT